MAATVIVVDDDPTMRDLLSALLSEAGLQTIACSDSLSALHAIRTQRPALAIIDLAMPVMDGRELIEHVRQEPGKPLPVIALSGAAYTPPDDSLQVDAYLTRPLDLEELLEQVTYLTCSSDEPDNQHDDAEPAPAFRASPERRLP